MREAALAPDARCHVCHDEAELEFGGETWCRDCYHAVGQSCSGWRPRKTSPTQDFIPLGEASGNQEVC